MRTDELDHLASAAAPITPDPVIFTDNNSQRDEGAAHAELVRRLMAGGMSRKEAIVVAARQMAQAPDEPVAAPAPVMQPPAEETVTPDQIRAQGLMSQAEPGPQVWGGGKVTPGQSFDKMSAASDYMTRPPVLDEDVAYRTAHFGAVSQPSPRDLDMAERGLFPVSAPDGSVAYMVGTGEHPVYTRELGPRDVPGGFGRLGPREDLEEQDPSQAGFTLVKRRGPTGWNYVYEPNDAARAKQDAYRRERQLYRDARVQGVSPAQILENSPGEYGDLTAGGQRDRVGARAANEGARLDDERLRTDRWRAQMMLAGQNRAKNQVNAFSMMDEPGVSEDQRQSLQYMLPGGVLAAQVDAAAAGQKADRNTPDGRLVDAQIADLDRKRRDADPVAAGRQDLAAGNSTSPMAQKEADRLADQYDSGDEGAWWLGGADAMSDKDEANLAAALVRDYRMDETLARETARAAADRRRLYGKRGPLPVAPPAPRGAPRPAAPPRTGR